MPAWPGCRETSGAGRCNGAICAVATRLVQPFGDVQLSSSAVDHAGGQPDEADDPLASAKCAMFIPKLLRQRHFARGIEELRAPRRRSSVADAGEDGPGR